MNGEERRKVCHLGMGSSIHVQRWVNYFAEKGWGVDLITFEPADKQNLHPEIKQHCIKRLNIPWLGYIVSARRVSKLIKSLNPDIIHAHSADGYGIYALVTKKMSKPKPIVLTAWGFSHMRTHKGLKRIYEKKGLLAVDIITTQDNGLKSALLKNYSLPESKFHVFHWGIDLDMFKRGYTDEVTKLKEELSIIKDTYVIMSTRELMPYYNISSIVMSIPYVLKKYPRCVFVFLKGKGDNMYLKKIRALAMKLGIYENTRFVDKYISYGDVPVYLNLADIVVMLPYTDQASMSLVEALACGNIVLASNLKGNREWIEDGRNGFLVKVKRPGELNIQELIRGENFTEYDLQIATNSIPSELLGEKIIECLDYIKEKDNMTRINRSIVNEKANWKNGAKKMEQIYFRLLEKYK